MDIFKKLVSDAVIISLVAVYSYFVYLMGEIGYLNAFGIKSAASLVTLELQNVILGFLVAVGYFLISTLVILLTLTALKVTREDSKGIYDSARGKLALFLLLILSLILSFPKLEDIIGSPFAYIITVGTSLLLVFVIFIKFPVIKSTLPSYFEKHMNIFFYDSKEEKSVSGKRLFITSTVLALILIPVINYIVSYNNATQDENATVRIIERENVEYALIKQYSDKNIFVQINNGKYLPNYLIERGDRLNDVSYKLIRVDTNNSLLFLRSQKIVDANEKIQNFFDQTVSRIRSIRLP